MAVKIDETVLPDINGIRAVRVAIATDKRTGKEGIMTAHLPGMGPIPMVWGDDARTEMFMQMLKSAAKQAHNMKVEVKCFLLSDETPVTVQS